MSDRENVPTDVLERVAVRTTMDAMRCGLLGRYITALKAVGAPADIVRAELPIMTGLTGNRRQLAQIIFRIQLDSARIVEGSLVPVLKSRAAVGSEPIDPFLPEDIIHAQLLDDNNLRDGVWCNTPEREITLPQQPYNLPFVMPNADDFAITYRPRSSPWHR